MFIHDTRTCHFVIWTPNFCFPVICEFDDNCLDQTKIYIAHELVTRNFENDYANTVKAAIVDAPIYCYCRKAYTENDEMIGCDNENCKYNGFIFPAQNSNVHLKVYGTVKSAKNKKKM